MYRNQSGFTLVELSIVLVILGLLIGGVLTGQSLIRAAELRSVATQQARYITAVQTFRDKYFALPGDMSNATAYWGAADGAGGITAGCKTTASTTALTCNGDGNGQIVFSLSYSNEIYRFWQHLANAGLIEGNYDGITHGSNNNSSTVANSPVGRISSSMWFSMFYGSQSGGGNLVFDGQYDHMLAIGSVVLNNWPYLPVLKPEEAYNLDTKMDDGKPATGRAVSIGTMAGAATNCTDAANSTVLSANYLLTNTALSCGLMFRQAY